MKDKVLKYYEEHETRIDILFFLGGFAFDILMLSDIDDPFSIIQQVVYVLIVGLILAVDILLDGKALRLGPKLERIWPYSHLVLHFLLGNLLNLYSLFFLKSSSLFASFLFLLFILSLVVGNELKIVRSAKVNIKLSLWIICLFSFFATLVPVVLGFVGFLPFLLSVVVTLGVVVFIERYMKRRGLEGSLRRKQVMWPAAVTLGVLVLFYVLKILPPVPLSVKKMGIYHDIKKQDNQYLLMHERPIWKFWQSGDQDFVAEPGDKIYFYASVFSPARFSDVIFLHWSYKDRGEWHSSDRIKISLLGGRRGGYRGFSVKENFSDGEWRVTVETTDGREMGRLYLNVKKLNVFNPERTFSTDLD